MVATGEDHGSLLVAESLDGVEGVGVAGDVDDRVVEAQLVQRTVGRVALHTSRLGEDGDGHESVPFVCQEHPVHALSAGLSLVELRSCGSRPNRPPPLRKHYT